MGCFLGHLKEEGDGGSVRGRALWTPDVEPHARHTTGTLQPMAMHIMGFRVTGRIAVLTILSEGANTKWWRLA